MSTNMLLLLILAAIIELMIKLNFRD